MDLPEAFVKLMNSLLGSEAGDFFAAHEKEALKAFHLNTSRISKTAFDNWLSAQDELIATPCVGGYGYNYSFKTDRSIGSLPIHHAGIVYSQDAAAQLPVCGVGITPDMRILDLCAAPGGKTSQLAMAVDGGEGFVIANEPNLARNKILISNMERMGYRNVITTCLDPSDIAAVYPEYFDLILVDAPCSGEGMFRKYPESISEWSLENVSLCAKRQREILKSAVSCLKPGGKLIYSTCTYAPEEDEEQLTYLCGDLGLERIEPTEYVSRYAFKTAKGAYRCYPHLYEGEGQFMAYFKKPGELSSNEAERLPSILEIPGKKEMKELDDNLIGLFASLPLYKYRDRFVIAAAVPGRLPARGVTSLGVTAAVFDEKKKRYIPHHQFFSAYGSDLPCRFDMDPADPQLKQYINGMELSAGNEFSKGYAAVCVLGVPVGGVRIAGGRAKNLYPKGLRETHL